MRKIIFLSLFICLIPTIALSAPSINSVSGTFSDEQTVMISGSGFGSKSPAAPLVWAKFDGESSVTETSGRASLGNQGMSLTTSNQHANSTHSARGNGANGLRLQVTSDSGSDYFYMYVRRYYDHPSFFSSCSNIKLARYWQYCNSGYPDLMISMADWGYGRVIGYTNEPYTQWTQWYSGDPPLQQWIIEEYQTYQGTINSNNASLKIWWNGILEANESGFAGKQSSYPGQWGCIGAEVYTGAGQEPANAYVYMDDFYVDTTWARVMIGNNSNFNNCTHREVQIPTTWSNNGTSIAIKVNQGTFKPGQIAYLFVVDATGNVNSQGYSITIGSGSSAPPPSSAPNPPTGLKIIE